MQRCIEIAQKGLGTTAPNPMVGAVIVHKNKIIGEGYTSPYGGSHAEVNAIRAVADISLLEAATLYVTLEPCSHFGKTPPCADFIIEHKIPKVVVGILDPHKKVAGKGIERLRASGCDVTVGVLEHECHEHHRRFLTFHQKKRPYITLKWAETADGFIAPQEERRSSVPQPHWITNSHSRQLVHKWRSEEQAIFAGANTVLHDNPRLDVRQWNGRNPLRVILDKHLKTPHDYFVLDGSAPTLILTQITDASKYRKGIDYEIIDFSNYMAKQASTALFNRDVNSVIIEGGAKTLQTFIDANLWDEAKVFTGNTYFYKGIKAPELNGKIISERKIGTDLLKIYRPC